MVHFPSSTEYQILCWRSKWGTRK